MNTVQLTSSRVASAGLIRPTRAASRAGARRSVVVAASASEDRRTVLSGIAAGFALLSASGVKAVTPVELIDDRKAVENGFDIIYEARDLDLDQAQRDGLVQARSSIASTKARVAEASKRIKDAVAEDIKKEYWTDAKEELRRQVGTLRFDLNTLASSTGDKAARKAALGVNKDLLKKIEELDFQIRSKNKEKALSKLEIVVTSLDSLA
uniref:Photosystem II oxygen-evolving enhancer protein 3 n=1 Tax=Tetraselmis sp. GSL018 TaxID=582737 RepID=A0A061RFT2_9CHLO|mmetsp:Transcript_16977/g.40498  ORF Transcript_16977/g.40498 Transcript_16977/m.40498 type:complete len:209 (-) Transcript_16977:204-830(-)|eukprot:CAMPEP_0177583352 /NCGR_PEP_ID=MMETSP0419_2-20121207/3270_1 /TAXON_ID=582737 /ORGANISM="Tetraselmis sp., Strain GSL018" /LENGTH=208 /DNA_ID=CAMNT_0019072725 /DNA_START=85 /DNA_END=711 /DNA_ORIENTATION=+